MASRYLDEDKSKVTWWKGGRGEKALEERRRRVVDSVINRVLQFCKKDEPGVPPQRKLQVESSIGPVPRTRKRNAALSCAECRRYGLSSTTPRVLIVVIGRRLRS